MPNAFKLLFKKGRTITFAMRRFRLENEKFTFTDNDGFEIEHTYILVSDVSAIVPIEFSKSEYRYIFNVHLREHVKPIEIPGVDYEIDDSSTFQFFVHDFYHRRIRIDNLYIPVSEVIAIFPIRIES